MKWRALPGPGSFIDRVVERIRGGVSTVVATPSPAPPDIEAAITDLLNQDRWVVHRCNAESVREPLAWLTDQLYLQPESWVEWTTESLFERLSPSQVISIEGVTEETWDSWLGLLKDFEAASRRRSADERPVLLLFVRGVTRKRLQFAGAVSHVEVWTGVVGELDILVYVDQLVRERHDVARHHKLLIRQIAALALWDLELAEFLVERPSSEIFDAPNVLRAAGEAFEPRRAAIGSSWENGGLEKFDDQELLHPFVLMKNGDPRGELTRRVWAAQAAELLPLIEVRRRASAKSLERHIRCPFWIDHDRKVDTLEDLEIGSLAFAAHTHKAPAEMREKVQWLAECRNALAHLRVLSAFVALDARFHE